MSQVSTNAALVTFSIKVYRLLLVSYPAGFRQEYGTHMVQLFQDCSIRSYRQGGASGMLSLWAVTLFDLIRSLVDEHLQKETIVNKALLIRLSGWALILGAVLFSWGFMASALMEIRFFPYPGLYGFYEGSTEFGVILFGPPLIAVGMIGLLVQYGGGVGPIGKTALLIGAIGGAGAIPLAYLFEAIVPRETVGRFEGWILGFVVGLMLMFTALALFGFLALRRKAMPQWNGLPIIAGLWFPTLAIMSLATGSVFLNSDSVQIIIPTLLIFATALIVLGYNLHTDSHEEPAFA
jgi:hypothetical protein